MKNIQHRMNACTLIKYFCFFLVINSVNSACENKELDQCELWCNNHPSPWKGKCQWSESCGGCSQCRCKPWCANNPTPWKDPIDNENIEGNFKCNWTKSCSGCPECKSGRVPTVSPTPAPTKGCKNWCVNHPKTWSEKCGWPKNCGGCPECNGTTPAPSPESALRCKSWCWTHPTPWWRDNDGLDGDQKCSWAENCGGCSPCVPPTVSPSKFPTPSPSKSASPSRNTFPSPAPTKGCRSWCKNHPAPWDQKCSWPINCGGCPQCAPPSSFPTTIPSSSFPSAQPSSSFPSAQPSSSFPSAQPSSSFPPTRTSTSKGCETWCANHPAPWRDYSDPNASQKCHWSVNCGGCRECFEEFPPNAP